MTPFAARITRVDDPPRETLTTRIVSVMAETLGDAYAAILNKYPDWLVEMVDRDPEADLAAEMQSGEPT